MKIISFNVNGIRSAINKGLIDWLKTENPDIICFQEIKLSETELVEPLFKALNFHCHWYPAQKKGYSGVAVVSKIEPIEVNYGLGIDKHDNEGRTLIVDYKDFTLFSMYFPSGSSGDERQDVKIEFLNDFYTFIKSYQANHPSKKLVICGDVNICHQEIDIHNPKSNAKTSGFLPEERQWLSKFLALGFIDTFRFFNKEPHQYSWWSYRAGSRAKNLGWRIDYLFASNNLEANLSNGKILQEINMSDHCPISLELKF